MVKIRKHDSEKFLKIHFPSLDELINTYIKGVISGKEFALLIWMCSYAWIIVGKKRNEFTIPIAAIAKDFGVKRGTVEKWLKNLADKDFIKPNYQILIRSNSSKRPHVFETQPEAWNFKNKYGGTQLPTTYTILVKGIHARMGKKKFGLIK